MFAFLHSLLHTHAHRNTGERMERRCVNRLTGRVRVYASPLDPAGPRFELIGGTR